MIVNIKSLLASLWSEIKDIWEKTKIYILAGIGLLLFLKWRKIKDDVIVNAANKEIQNSNKQDQSLETQENIDKAGANALVNEANSLSQNQPPVDADWYKKEN